MKNLDSSIERKLLKSPKCPSQIYNVKKKKKKKSSHHDSAEKNLTSIHEDTGSIPDPAQRVKDPVPP